MTGQGVIANRWGRWRAGRAARSAMPGYVRHFSLSPGMHWLLFRLLHRLLRYAPCPVWRLPAALIASAQAPFDTEGRALSAALLMALGRPATRRAVLALHWRHCYQRAADFLIVVQALRLTRGWARRHVACTGTLPAGGAVLVAPHHAGQGVALLAIADRVGPLGGVGAAPTEEMGLAAWEPTRRDYVRLSRPLIAEAFGPHLFRPHDGVRTMLAFLRAGGYLSITGDDFYYPHAASVTLLGRAFATPGGAAWLATQSGMPLIPYAAIPHRGGWRLWIGEPVPPTTEGVVAAIEMCIRRAPESWARTMAMAWRDAPPADTMER